MFTYVYILQSEAPQQHYYVGMTSDLRKRLARHNEGAVPHASRYRPWMIKTAVAFRDPQRAAAFERYLKSPSGRAFARKRL
jgi:predicted GIY-YIG superfamily endonuclease